MQVNAISNQFLIKLLLPILKKNKEEKARVITVSSLTAISAQYEFFDDLKSFSYELFPGQMAYVFIFLSIFILLIFYFKGKIESNQCAFCNAFSKIREKYPFF
jgi:hypothetical protein